VSAQTIAAIAGVAVLMGEIEEAAHLWGAVQGMRAAHGATTSSNEDAEEDQRTVAWILSAMGPTTALDAFSKAR